MQRNFCSQCGQPVEPGANFCTRCGAVIHPAPQQQAPVQPTLAGNPQVQPQQSFQQPQQVPQTHHQPQTPPPAPQPMTAPTVEPPQGSTPSAPNFHDIVPKRHLAPRAKILFFFNYVLISSILLPFMIGFLFFDPFFAATLITGYLAICYIAAMISYNNFYFSIDQNGFEKDYGVFFKKHVSIPFDQIQNVNTTRTIVDRFIGIARLDIETAGSASIKRRDIAGGVRSLSEGHLPGVNSADAREFHDLLLRKIKGNDN